MRQIIRQIAAESRRKEFFWRYGFNFSSSLNHFFAPTKKSNETAHRITETLDRDGIAVASIEEFDNLKTNFIELEQNAEKILHNRSSELEKLKSEAGDLEKIGSKTFNVELLGSTVNFEPHSVFARFALDETLLDIADSYFGLRVKMRYYNVWKTFATQAAARESQLWHFDREDNYILKVFLYLNDVGEGAGPFTYAAKTHPKGNLHGREPEFFLENGVRRTTDEQMAAAVSKEHWVKATGKKGTIIFADTRGYHKGGEARTDDRLMFTCMFTSPASQSQRLLRFQTNEPPFSLSKRQIAALEI